MTFDTASALPAETADLRMTMCSIRATLVEAEQLSDCMTGSLTYTLSVLLTGCCTNGSGHWSVSVRCQWLLLLLQQWLWECWVLQHWEQQHR